MNIQQAAITFIAEPTAEHEDKLIELLRAAKPEVSANAFIEYGCLEHKTVHVCDLDPDMDQPTIWWEIDPNTGEISKY